MQETEPWKSKLGDKKLGSTPGILPKEKKKC